MKYIKKPKKVHKTFEYELKNPNSSRYSLSVLIKKEVINILGLQKGDKLEITIREFEDKIGYDLKFVYQDETKSIPIDEIINEEIPAEDVPASAPNTTASDITDIDINTNPAEYHQMLMKKNKHTSTDTDEIFKITIHKNKRKNDNNNFKLEFKDKKNNNFIANITIGTLKETVDKLNNLSELTSAEVKKFILKNNPKAADKLKDY